MPKMIVISATNVNYNDDRGGVIHGQGELIDVNKEVARTLATNDRALYVNKADDHDKTGAFTASKALLDAAKKMTKAEPEATVAPQATE